MGGAGRGLGSVGVASGSRLRFVPRVVLSFKPIDVAFSKIWCLVPHEFVRKLSSNNSKTDTDLVRLLPHC